MVTATTAHIHEKFASIRKGLLEFLILKIVNRDKVYVADMLHRLEHDRVRDAGRHTLPAVEQDAARGHGRLRLAGVRRRASTQVLEADREREVAARRAQRLLDLHQRDPAQPWRRLIMQKLITVNLDSRLFQLDERAVQAPSEPTSSTPSRSLVPTPTGSRHP